MAAEENRIAHLRAIVEREAQIAGGKMRAGYRAVATAAGVGEEYVYQLYKGVKKTMGPDASRAIERAYGEGKRTGWMDMPTGEVIPSAHAPQAREDDDVEIRQFDVGGGMGRGRLMLDDQPGIIKSWHVDHDWLRLNVRSYSAIENLCIVTGFGPSMRPMFNPGDPLLVDRGVRQVDVDAVYFFRVEDHGFIKMVQRIPTDGGIVLRAKSKNPDYDTFDINPKRQDFEVLGKVLTVWKSEQF